MDRDSPNRPGTSTGRLRGRNDALMNVANRLQSPMYISDRALPPEEVTVSTIEGLLRLATLGSALTEEQLVASQCGEDGLVTDPDFLPGVGSLYPDPNQPPASAPADVAWRRVSGTLYFPSGKGARLLQGVLEDGAFLGALAAVSAARGGELLLDLIVSDDAAAAGAYTFQFFKHGTWQQVAVDNYLPCLADQERLAFACSAVVGELWPSLIEKAYAKVHGSYYALTGRAVHEHLVDLTGGVGFKIKLGAGEAGGRAAEDASLWADLQSWLSTGSIIACVARRKKGRRNRFAPQGSMGSAAEGEGPAAEGGGEVGEEALPDGGELEPEQQEEGPYGLQWEQVYTLLEVRQLDGRTRLARLHCPWPSGHWTGPWAQGSPEWQQPSAARHLEHVSATWQDEATFWMPYDTFTDFFNRLHVCRMFPPTWHQLTLHCGWQGPSAGGPPLVAPSEPALDLALGLGLGQGMSPPGANSLSAPGSAGGGPASSHPSPRPAANGSSHALNTQGSSGRGPAAGSTSNGGGTTAAPGATSGSAGGGGGGGGSLASSTWCCNPQFRITVRKPCEVVVCLGQQDPTVAARRHVPKRMRSRAVGMQVLRVPLDSLGRRWGVRSGELVASLPPCTAREVTVTFMAVPEHAYVVVPHAGRTGEEGAFVLRALGSSPLEVEQLPAPLCLVVGGHWSGFTAGGGRGVPTWGSNPQYMVSCAHRAQVVVSVTRLDLKYAVIKPTVQQGQDLDLLVCTPESGPEGPGRRVELRDEALVAAASVQGHTSPEEAVLGLTLEPEVPYLLAPCVGAQGVEAPYELRLLSGVPLELVPLPDCQACVLAGEWGQDSAGGCCVNPLWRRNPRYHVMLTGGAGRIRVTLRRTPSRRPTHPVEDMLGVYLLRASGPDGEIKGDPKRAIVAESTFVPQPHTTVEYELNGGCHYVIMPCTYGPGRTGRFSLSVSSAGAFRFGAVGVGHGAGGSHGHGYSHGHGQHGGTAAG